MGTRRLLLCVAAVTLLAVCQSCSVGREFITTFLQNYQGRMKDHKLQLVLTAQGSEAKVHIQVGSLEFSKQLTLSAHQTKWVCLPYESQLVRGGALANAAVRVSSSADISVVAFNHAPRTSAGTVVAPVTQLGVDYVAFTPGEGPRNMDKLVAVINGNGSNTVTFTPARGLKLRGGASWPGGKEQSVTLAPYETYLVRGNQDLSGTRIRSQQPVAVLGGHQCLSMGLNCEHVYEQLPPVSRMGKEYLVPSTGHDRHVREYAIIVAADDNTEVTVHRTNRNIITRKLQAGEKVVEKVNYKNPMMVRSNRKVMVLFLSNNRPYDPFLMVLAPSCELATDWSVETLGRGMSSRALVLSEREGAASVRVCVGGSCSSPKWTSFLFDSKWVWSSMPLGTVRGHMTVAGDARMAVYVYGGRSSYGYGTAGVCAQGVPPPPPPVDPCDGMTCKEKEKCVKGVCVHTTTATCRAAGDPHYLTFDGRHYDFQGTCTYTMTAVTEQAAGLTPFTVTTKNNHRGSRQVSFVRTVTVSVYNQTISINSHRGKVLVNGELVHLPVSLSGGKVSVKRSGSYAVLTTDFSLRVKYDWNSRLYITVPSSYYRHLGGLCGNYNGDRKDDLSEPTGKRLSAVLKMIQTWKVEDSNPFCSDNCGGHCPYCSPSQRTHYQKPSLCGVLAQKDGPFSACHDAVEPAMYLDNCVYDVCINKGARKILCDNLKSYADACLSEGVKVNPEWRTAANCPLSCPAGSHYEACGSACPSSCGSVDSEKQCTDPCVEGCQCDKGLVLSGDQCVPTSSCGCQHEGRYHPPGTTFWADNSCSSKCSCVRGEVTCKSVTCKKNERCAVKRGVRNCYPESFATCQAKGDPHYRTFDGRGFDFQGTCTYVFSQLVKGSDPDLVPFQVLVQNENRGRNKAVSYTKSVSITVYNNTVSMSSDDRDRVMVNGRIVNLPYSTATEELSIHRSGYFGFVKSAFGLTLKFNWRSNVWLTLPSIYSNAVAGLCGNYNKKAKDDFRKPDGSQDKSPNTFGHSWKAGGGLGCTSDCPGGKCPECAPALSVLYQKSPFCGIISDQKGPFKQCHAKLDHTEFLHDCVYDMCAYKGHTSALCGSLSAFSTACQEAGATVETWRTKDFCPPSCGPNSHYETCAAPCPQTCSGLVSPPACEEEEAGVCTEGCVCEDGFVLSDNTCVPVAECGCQYEGQYYHKGQVVYPGRGCSNRCVCLDDGQMKCDAFTCSANEKCDVSEGVATCVPESRDSCSVGGARTVTSFDGQDYPLWGDCIFTLSEVAEDNGELTAFSVLLRQHVAKDGGVTRSVEIQAYDYEIAMDTGVLWEIKVDDVRAILPLSLGEGKVRVNQNGINIVVETDFGLTVTYDTIAGVVLELPSTYRTAPRGLCGNYNDKPSDDFVLTGETRPASPGRFTAAWAVVRTGVVCKTGCGDAACPEPSGQKAPECDVIRAGQGPFAGCHAAVPPTPRYDACVKEMSTGDILSSDILCRHIQAYVFSCQSAGANVSRWRTDQFCPLRCPAGSHYELCADTCSSSCSYLLSPGRCPPRHEGCECDEGLAFDGGRCVPMGNCGCMVDGLYYKSGVSVFRDDCSESCECQSGRFSCKEHSCQKGEECGAKDGTLGCYTTDPCAELECREKERCEVHEGEAVCVAQSKAVCYGFGDPHYSTFDGWSYSFQGTCSYVLVNTTGRDPSLPQVTVTVKNELRGNDVGSFTRSVSVDLLGHRIDILRGQSGTVEVDGIRMRLPVILDGGSISITESGIRGVLQANIGVEVTFDWSTLIMVSISSSFHGNVGGLCGNYNGDRGDELAATRTGTAATTVVEWAKSWSVADDDVFCYHQCEGKCPQCATQDRLRLAGPQYCGVLANKTGPFSGCHAKVPVKQFAQDCLYDVCVNDGRQEVLCEALASYHAECQEGGVNVSPWREIANCPLVCPANSHYETCGTSCPETCGPKAESCPQTCVEGCFCDKGYVLSGHKCVIREKGCGCNHEDRYYLPGEVFWADKRCRSKCACDPATQKVACERRGCKAGEHCSVVDGVQDCYPVTFSTCQAQGDPHFRTFDGRKFDFQGNCVYRLASVCNETEGLERFEVSLESNNRGNTKVSYAKVVTVNVYGHSFTLALDYPGQVLVDGEAVHLPYSCNQSLVRVHRGNRLAVIETHFLKVSYDWRSLVRVQVATTYQNTLCGLCGNLNGDPKDDLTLPNGKAASSATEFGLSQWLANVPSCSHECKDCPPDHLARIPLAFTAVCEVIVSKDGPLRDCVSRVDSKQFRSDCIYDMTLTLGKDQAPACDIIADYVQECQEVGGNVENWRTKDFCSMNCPANSRYSLSAPGCPVTCSTPASKCRVPPSEGCVCNSGYLLSQDGCVRLSQCGCQFEGRYVPSGVKFYADADCQRFCVCSGGGTVSCGDKPCTGNEKCGVRKGKRCCYSQKDESNQGFDLFGAIKKVVDNVFDG